MKLSHLIQKMLFVFLVISVVSCEKQKKKRVVNFPKTNLIVENFIPKPLKVKATHSGFALDKYTVIHTDSQEEGYVDVANYLADKIKSKIGLEVPVNNTQLPDVETIIYIKQSDEIALKGEEAYRLNISQDSIVLSSKTVEGSFRGIQTLRQIIPNTSNDSLVANTKIWTIPTGVIEDTPQFEFRASMLDVARHFFSAEDVKKYIDVLAYYKYNALHLHLSDDQGWRIEIKSWPKLTEVGGSTEVGGASGGFYTQEEYKSIVNYAAKRHMLIIPEIDMPGHTNAASVSYPFLNGNGKKLKLYEGIEVGFSTFDTSKDTVYAFVDDVIRELSEITPGPYIHIGGDESLVTKNKDYIYFVNKVEKIVQKHNKIMIGWDEIATADVDSTSISQFWESKENAITSIKKGMKIILSPAKKAYLDMKYDTNSKFGLHWAGYIPVDTAYTWNPESYEEIPYKSILGLEAPLWSETVSNIEELEYLAFPRAIGYAELAWTIQDLRDWNDFKKRLANQTPYLNRMNIKYYPSKLIDWKVSDNTPNRLQNTP